jgi:hypothetical protein
VRHSCATLNPDQPNARSPERAQRPCVFFLTLTYMEVGKPYKFANGRLAPNPANVGDVGLGIGWMTGNRK